MAQTYLRYTLYTEPIQLKRLNWLVVKVEEQANRLGRPLRILDMGCGTGMVSMPLAALGHYVEAGDLDTDSIAFATKRSPFPNLKFFSADCASEEFPKLVSPPYDVILASDIIEHVERPEMLICNAIRCGSPTTMYLFTTCNFNLWEAFDSSLRKFHLVNALSKWKRHFSTSKVAKELMAAHGTLNTQERGAPHIQHFTLGRLKKLFAAQGLQVEEIVKVSSFFLIGSFGSLRSHALQRFDFWLGSKLPRLLAGGWYLYLRHQTEPLTIMP